MSFDPVFSRFKDFVYKVIPGKDLDKSGAILYSSYHTLKSGKLYILGSNPGGDPKEQRENTIRRDLEDIKKLDENYSEYLEKWGKYEPGQAPLQKSIRYIVENIFGLDVRKVCASNLIFLRSKRENDIDNWRQKANEYWPIHKFIITEIVKPQVIISFGTGKTFDFAQKKMKFSLREKISYYWGNLKVKVAINEKIFNRPLILLGFPHLGRYSLVSGDGSRKEKVEKELLNILPKLLER